MTTIFVNKSAQANWSSASRYSVWGPLLKGTIGFRGLTRKKNACLDERQHASV